jgi:hypothetical protein
LNALKACKAARVQIKKTIRAIGTATKVGILSVTLGGITRGSTNTGVLVRNHLTGRQFTQALILAQGGDAIVTGKTVGVALQDGGCTIRAAAQRRLIQQTLVGIAVRSTFQKEFVRHLTTSLFF